MSILRVTDLCVSRGGLPVLQGVSFGLEPGRVLVLRGPNGLGKTTLLRTLAGLQPARAGQIELDEDAVAYAGHSDGLKSMLSVRENLRFWADVHGGGDIAPALAQMDLEALQERRAISLSAGQKRRLGLARLILARRALWILDEPTVSLDTASVALFGAVLRSHLATGGAALIATHIDLGLPEAEDLDLSPYRARLDGAGMGPGPGAQAPAGFDEAFL